jgi:ATP-dependent Clp protease ATP-binding subunit ClpA
MPEMSEIEIPAWTVLQRLDRLVLGEALGFPEVSRLETVRRRVTEHLRRNLRRLIAAAPLSRLHRCHLGGEPVVTTVAVPLEPLAPNAWWREPLALSFPVLTWRHGDGAALAFVPALGIEVVADRPDELDARLPAEIRAALSRGSDLSLFNLVILQRVGRVRVQRQIVRVRLHSAKARAQADERDREKIPSILAQVATDLTRGPFEPTYGLEPIVAQLAELLTARTPRCVLLVGPSGVGKTAAMRELAQRRADHDLAATPFWATSGARLVAGMSGYGMWQERCRQVVREAIRRRAIVHVGNLVELMQVGKSEHNNAGLAAFLRPSLARGDLLAIAECTPEQLPLIEREDPHLLAAFHLLTVPEPTPDQSRSLLRQAAADATSAVSQVLTEDGLDTLDRLHRRYASYSAYPGRPLRFLQRLLRDCRDSPVVGAGHVLTAFARETGLPRLLLDPEERLDLDRTRGWLAERVIGQAEAVELVADLIATTKAGLSRPRRPIASLLFIGPTGVGKTEMAKALAEFLFATRDRLTRFDMSEFGDAVAVQRLVGGVFGSEGLLTARVREQPFGVLLLDEFEKAHPLFFDLLLQVLGEGRLTDAAGRLADFTNTVVILTSNLGAESFQQGAFGFGNAVVARSETGHNPAAARQAAARDHFVRAVKAFVRPELFNRIDRLVPFAPLDADVIRRIAGRHLQRLEARDGIRYRGVSLSIGAGVAEHLARAGFDARYGARPLLRAVERELLAPLAQGLNRHGTDFALNADVRLEDGAVRCAVKVRTDAAGRPLPTSAGGSALTAAANSIVDLRRSVQALERCRSLREFHNELYELERVQERFERRQRGRAAWMARLANAPDEVRRRALAIAPRVRPGDQERMARLARLRETAERLRELTDGSSVLEERALLALYADGESTTPDALSAAVAPLRAAWDDMLLTLYSRDFPQCDRITFVLFAENPAWLCELAGAYVGAAQGMGVTVEAMAYRLPETGKTQREPEPDTRGAALAADDSGELPQQYWHEDTLYAAASGRRPERPVLVRERIEEPAAFFATAQERLPGVALRLRGNGATPRFTSEQGLHVLRAPRLPQPVACLVEVSDVGLPAYLPPSGITRRGAIGTQTRRRIYDRGLEVIDDAMLAARLPWSSRLADALAEVIEKGLRRAVSALLEE